MEVRSSDSHTEQILDLLSIGFLAVQTAQLDNTLREQGINDPDQRREICHTYVFSLATFTEAGWFQRPKVAGQYFPLICFAERGPETSGRLGPVLTLHVPTDATSPHEYVAGIVDEYFDSGGPWPDLHIGSAGTHEQ